MLTDDQVRSAADMLVGLREGRRAISALPAELEPKDTTDTQRIIDAVSARLSTPIRGWKTYCVYKPMNPIMYAPIYDVFANGAQLPAHISPGRLIEPEIMFRVDRDLPVQERRYTVDEVRAAVTAIVGFEVIGSRFAAGGGGTLYGALSDHLANGCIVVGDAIGGWEDVAFEDVRLRMTEDERELISVVGCHPFDDPFLPAVVGINRLRRHRGAKAGDIIVTSSSTSFFPVDAGTLVRASYEGLGEVTATFAAG